MARTPTDRRDVGFADNGPYNTSSASGMTPVSGVGPSAAGWTVSGPWFIETQTLDFNYVRVPEGNTYEYDISLSSNSVVISNFATRLQCQIFATYKAEKTYDFYNTSSWTQPQRFSILAMSADAGGSSYGDLSSASAFGPAGSVVTSQKYFRRVPWDQTLHSSAVVSQAIGPGGGWNYVALRESDGVSSTHPATEIFGDYNAVFIPPHRKGSSISDSEIKCDLFNGVGWLWGPYSIDQESAEEIWSVIDWIGNMFVQPSMLWALHPTLADITPGPTLNYSEGVLNYEISRHSYI